MKFTDLIKKIMHTTPRRLINKAASFFSAAKYHAASLLPSKVSKPIPGIANLAKAVQETNGSWVYGNQHKPAVGIISDEYMFNYYKDALDLRIIRPSNVQEGLDGVCMLLYITCWRGMYDDELRGEQLHNHVVGGMFDAARAEGIPVVFTSIEDPSNYERFLGLAKKADFVFTTALEAVSRYKADTGNPNCHLLEFGVNPLVHNPVGISDALKAGRQNGLDGAFFAGSYMRRYKQRCKDMREIFDGVIDSGKQLVIADRNYGMAGYSYPLAYAKMAIKPINHLLLQNAHKLFRFSININSITDSETMCAMRTYELQALGCLVLSNYTLSISRIFPGIFICLSRAFVPELLNAYSEVDLAKFRAENLRVVMGKHTVYDRLNSLFSITGMPFAYMGPEVVVACDKITKELQSVFNRQSFKGAKLVHISQAPKEGASLVCYFDSATPHIYSPYHVEDLANAFKYANASFVTKDPGAPAGDYSFFFGAARFSYSMAKASFWEGNLAGEMVQGDGLRIDAADSTACAGRAADLAVIIPVYNNGNYLLGRCFRSLVRSSVFNRMMVYLVDDGSTDPETGLAMEYLAQSYPNVRCHYCEGGASGSASRPRNVGLEISSEAYVTYLDPDNEAVCDAYAKLLAKLEETGADFAFGPIVKMAEKTSTLGYLSKATVIGDTKNMLIKEKFRTHSIQACLARRDLLVSHNITNPVGAVGQDSLFFMQMCLYANSAVYITDPVHIYFAERAGSVVNTVNPDFFAKSLILEKEQAEILASHGVYNEYVEKRLDGFFEGWYLEKLKAVDAAQRQACIQILEEILALYSKSLSDYGVER
ncbi:MAG: glycosyltransferase [Eubacteriaceae bacterium]|nr:glycosyltransferase [Eubacteriaceae bacterium]